MFHDFFEDDEIGMQNVSKNNIAYQDLPSANSRKVLWMIVVYRLPLQSNEKTVVRNWLNKIVAAGDARPF